MDDATVESIRNDRAVRASGRVIGSEHEVVNQELRTTAEEVNEGRLSFIGLKAILLLDSNPGKLLAPPRQLVTTSRKFLLRLEEIESGGEPLFTCSGFMLAHCFYLSIDNRQVLPDATALTNRNLIL